MMNLGVLAVWFVFTPDVPAQPGSDESYGVRLASSGYHTGGQR